MIIGLQGYAGSGKSTCAQYLVERHGFARRHIKAPIADMTRVLLQNAYEMPLIDTYDYIDGHWKREPLVALGGRSATEIQQFLGTEFGREFIHPDLWLDIWSKWAASQPGRVVQESVRFANEAERCDVIWEIRRPGFEAHNGHVSEGLPCQTPDAIVENNGDLEKLYADIDWLLTGKIPGD